MMNDDNKNSKSISKTDVEHEHEARESSAPAKTREESAKKNAPETSSSLPSVLCTAGTRPQISTKRCFPTWRGKPVYHGNEEALAWGLDIVARDVAFVAMGAFVGTALLRIAKEAAGCETQPPPGSTSVPECIGKVYGIRPSSLLTTYTMTVGVVSAALMPLMGAFVDFTDKRLRLGRISSAVFCCLLVPTIFIGTKTWFAVAICLLLLAFIGWIQTMVTYAYLPELTDSEEHLNQYTQSFSILSFGSMVLLLAFVIGVSTMAGFGDDDVAAARLAQSTSLVVNTVLLYIAWFCLLKPRPPLREIPSGQTLWTAGFIQIYHTSIHIYKHLPALKWFYVSVSFIDAGVYSLTTILVTYLTDTLAFTARENGLVSLIVLLAGVPGSLLAGYTVMHWNPVRSSIAATTLMSITTIVFAIVVTGPGQQLETYILASGWGVPIGWKWTVDRLMASTFIPTGQDAELMGTFLFAGQVLSWLPPLIFTVLNESGVSQSIGIGTLAIWFGLGIASLLAIGNYRDAIVAVGRENLLSSSPSSSAAARHGGSPENNEQGDHTTIPVP